MPLPDEAALPGWRVAASDYYLAMNRLTVALMHSVARGLVLSKQTFDAAVEGGIPTLRLFRYPLRSESSFKGLASADVWANESGVLRYGLSCGHMDTGFMTLLAQDGVDGLQAQKPGPHLTRRAAKGGHAGGQFWQGAGALDDRCDSSHRALGAGLRRERYSIPADATSLILVCGY